MSEESIQRVYKEKKISNEEHQVDKKCEDHENAAKVIVERGSYLCYILLKRIV